MKIQPNAAIVLFVVSSMMAGCSDSTQSQETRKSDASQTQIESGATIEKKSLPIKIVGTIEELPEDAVIISVNGKELTKGTFTKWVALHKAVNGEAISSMMSGADPTEIIMNRLLASITNDYSKQIVASDYARSVGIEVGTNIIERFRSGFMTGAKIQTKSWDKVLDKFDEDLRSTINERVLAEATVFAVSEKFFADNPVDVSQEEIDKLYSSYLEYNKKCAVTNDATWAKASNIWQRIISGESFEDLAIQFDEDESREENGIWGDFNISEFSNEPEIWKLVNRFRPGYVSPPVEADNGITIIKVNSIDDEGYDVNASDYVPSATAEINMSRIFIHLPLFYEEIDKEKFAQECQKAKRTAEFMHFIDGLLEKATIEFPCGTDIFNPGANQPQMMMPGN